MKRMKEHHKLNKTFINFLMFLNSILKNKSLHVWYHHIFSVFFFFLHLTTNINIIWQQIRQNSLAIKNTWQLDNASMFN